MSNEANIGVPFFFNQPKLKKVYLKVMTDALKYRPQVFISYIIGFNWSDGWKVRRRRLLLFLKGKKNN